MPTSGTFSGNIRKVKLLILLWAAVWAVILAAACLEAVESRMFMTHGLFFLTAMGLLFSMHHLFREGEEDDHHQASLSETELLSMMLDNVGEGMIATCARGRVILFNRVAEEITGWPRTDAIGRELNEIYQRLEEATARAASAPAEETVSGKEPASCFHDVLLVTRNGEKRLIEENVSVTRDLQGNRIGTMVLFRDISSRYQLERQAVQSEKLECLGTLAGGIAHDFNNLLTAVLGNIRLARLHADPGSRIIDHLDAAERASRRTRNLIQQLLGFARGGAPIRQVIAIGDLIEDAAQAALQNSSLQMKMAMENDIWRVDADPDQLSQVLRHLLDNADHAMPDGGKVEVRTENVSIGQGSGTACAPGNYVKITIKDQGVGIPPENLPHIFDPYFTTKQKGSGLGLASSYSIIKRHNGHIVVDSRVGAGTTFSLYLPAIKDAARTIRDLRENEETSSS